MWLACSTGLDVWITLTCGRGGSVVSTLRTRPCQGQPGNTQDRQQGLGSHSDTARWPGDMLTQGRGTHRDHRPSPTRHSINHHPLPARPASLPLTRNTPGSCAWIAQHPAFSKVTEQVQLLTLPSSPQISEPGPHASTCCWATDGSPMGWLSEIPALWVSLILEQPPAIPLAGATSKHSLAPPSLISILPALQAAPS